MSWRKLSVAAPSRSGWQLMYSRSSSRAGLRYSTLTDGDRKEHSRVARQLALHDAVLAQPLGARALEETQVVGVVDDAAGVGVLPVDTRLPAEGAHPLSPNSGRLAAARSGTLRPKCCQVRRVAMRPRAVRIRKPCWIRKRLDHVLERAALLADRGGETVDADRTAVELLHDREQQPAIERVEAPRIDVEQVERGVRDRLVDAAAALHLGVVAHAPQQPVGDAWRAARALGDAPGAAGVDRHVQDPAPSA